MRDQHAWIWQGWSSQLLSFWGSFHRQSQASQVFIHQGEPTSCAVDYIRLKIDLCLEHERHEGAKGTRDDILRHEKVQAVTDLLNSITNLL